tara:strand:+ start:15633 stop:15962 length:330 start_codon:yes stop_codon:yes gene_type:complete
MIDILQEVTDWGKYKVNNGVYHVNSAGKLVAYQPDIDAPVQTLNVPSTQFSKSRRKFKKIGERPEELNKNIIEVKGSKGNVYLVDTEKNTCTCPGFTYRGYCKHVKEYC